MHTTLLMGLELLVALSAAGAPATAGAVTSTNSSVHSNPFVFPRGNRVAPEATVDVKLEGADAERVAQRIDWVGMAPGSCYDEKGDRPIEVLQERATKLSAHLLHGPRLAGKEVAISLQVRMPSTEVLGDLLKAERQAGAGWWFAHPVCLAIFDSDGRNGYTWQAEVGSRGWAMLWGGFAAVVPFLLVGLLGFSKKRQLAALFSYLTVPWNHFSLSLLQLWIWTMVTAFGIVYVWRMSELFLNVTPQMLALLGIASGTSLAGKLNAQGKRSALSSELRKMSEERQDTPGLGDFVSERGQVSLAKVQMLLFTVIIALFVLKEIWQSFAFPELSAELVTLMGISAATYVANGAAGATDQQAKALEAERLALVDEQAKLEPAQTDAAKQDAAKQKPKLEERWRELANKVRTFAS